MQIIYERITINLIYMLILTLELVYLVSSSKNRILLKKYHYIYLVIVLSICVVFVLNPSFFSDFIGIKDEEVFYEFKGRIEIMLLTWVILCFNYYKGTNPLGSVYSLGLFLFVMVISMVEMYKTDLFIDGYIYIRLVTYILMVLVLMYLILNVFLDNARTWNNYQVNRDIVKTVLVMMSIIICGCFAYTVRYVVEPSRMSIFLSAGCNMFLQCCAIVTIIITMYIVIIWFDIKNIILFFGCLSIIGLFLVMYYRMALVNYDACLLNLGCIEIRLNYTSVEQLEDLKRVWEALKPIYGGEFENRVQILLEYYAKKENISLDVLETDFRCAIHLAYCAHLRDKFLF